MNVMTALRAATILVCAAAVPLHAQSRSTSEAQIQRSDAIGALAVPSVEEKIDVASIAVPSLAFSPDPNLAGDFDKYFYFHRADTEFATALADIRDCDDLARGLVLPFPDAQVPYPNTYTVAGAIGGMIGNAMVAAIFSSAQIRSERRINMRRCMHYKGYQRFGLPKEIWQKFNFEEGLARMDFADALPETKRQAYLMQQAKIASGPMPLTEALGK